MNQITTTTENSQLSTLTDRLSVATALVQPASDDVIKSRLLMMQRSGLQWPPGIDAGRAPEIYCFALKRLSIQGIKDAVERIVQGLEGADRYIPTPPALAAIVRRVSVPLFDDVARIRETIQTIEEGREARESNSPERLASIERVRAMVADVLETNRLRQEAERPPPMSEAEANYLFRNRVDEPDPPPQTGKFNDHEWQQRYEEENGQGSQGSDEDQG